MKRILSIDGGGIRGVFALQILKRVEALFRQHHDDPELRLSDAVDFFAGTSTGAIIATCLSWGMAVDEIEKLYVEQGSRMFTRSPWYLKLRAKYRADNIAHMFRDIFQEPDGSPSLMGTDRLKTTLMVVMRNASTGSPWPLTNHPDTRFNQRDLTGCNLDMPLWQVLRASTAAPTYFTPERIQVGDQSFLFVDGGITPYNNPALLAALTATLPAYRIQWPTGPDQLHLISVGTGRTRSLLRGMQPEKINILRQIGFIPPALLGSVSDQQDMLCRVMGDCLYGQPLDAEVGDLRNAGYYPPDQQKFTYVRYDTRLDVNDDSTLLPPLVKARLDDLNLIPQLQQLGQAYAESNVKPAHLFSKPAAAPTRNLSSQVESGRPDLN
ncbi:MAG: patatin-like phospholipase family protein [Planctomycetota bacterium]